MAKQLVLILAMTLLSIGQSTTAFAVDLPTRLKAHLQVGAHRGGVLSGKGNTLSQFRDAIAEGADILETDLQLTADGIPVLFHDAFLDRETNCSGDVETYSLAELRLCKFRRNNETIATYEELLQLTNGRAVVNAEFKTPAAIPSAIRIAKKYNATDWTYFQTQASRSNYKRARAVSAEPYLIYHAKNQAEVDWAIAQRDPRLLLIELSPNFHEKSAIDKIHAAGMLASGCSFQFVDDAEKSGQAGCATLKNLGFDIFITNQTKACGNQR